MSDDGHSFSDEEIEILEENDEVEKQNEEEQVATENQQETTDANQKQEVKVKKVRNPQPKLDSQRLKGPRGIQTLEGIFEKIKFKGRGHEEEDLKTLLRGYEYWCHRLFPKFKFEDCIEKIERLGTKKDVQTHIKKIRMNMLFLDEVSNDEEVESQHDPFNALLTTTTQRSEPLNTHTDDYELSEEQLERIRANRERALKRRQELTERDNTVEISTEHSQEVDSSSMFETMNVSVDVKPNEHSLESRTINADEFLTEEPSTSFVRALEEQ